MGSSHLCFLPPHCSEDNQLKRSVNSRANSRITHTHTHTHTHVNTSENLMGSAQLVPYPRSPAQGSEQLTRSWAWLGTPKGGWALPHLHKVRVYAHRVLKLPPTAQHPLTCSLSGLLDLRALRIPPALPIGSPVPCGVPTPLLLWVPHCLA